MFGRVKPAAAAPEVLVVGATGRVSGNWQRSLRLGEPCAIPLSLASPDIETRLYLKHDGLFYLEPFGQWDRRREIYFLPEAPGSYTILIEWRRHGQTGWTDAHFVVDAAERDTAPRLVSIESKVKLWVPSAWESGIAAVHEKRALALAAQVVQPGAVIYDIGANLGLYSVLLSRMAGKEGRLYSLEANPACLYFLQANLALNRVPRYEILPVAVLDDETTIDFRVNYRNFLVGVAGQVPHLGKPGQVIRVAAAPLDLLIERHQLAPPDFIKMDIEGAEVLALAGMQRTIREVRPSLLMELHGQAAARGALGAVDWSGYSFVEVQSGQSFSTAAELASWFPESCLQVIARR
jgi:FkbM family methyltransferase